MTQSYTKKLVLGVVMAWLVPSVVMTFAGLKSRSYAKPKSFASLEDLPNASLVVDDNSEQDSSEMSTWEGDTSKAELMDFYKEWSTEKDSLKIYTYMEKIGNNWNTRELGRIEKWFEDHETPAINIETLTNLLLHIHNNRFYQDGIFALPPMFVLTGMTDYDLLNPEYLKKLSSTLDLLELDETTLTLDMIEDFMTILRGDYTDMIQRAKLILKQENIDHTQVIIPFTILMIELNKTLPERVNIAKTSKNQVVQYFFQFLTLFTTKKKFDDKDIPALLRTHMLYTTQTPEDYLNVLESVYLLANYLNTPLTENNIKTILLMDPKKRITTIKKFITLLKEQGMKSLNADDEPYFESYFVIFTDMIGKTADFFSIKDRAEAIMKRFFKQLDLTYWIYYVKVSEALYDLYNLSSSSTKKTYDSRFKEIAKELGQNFPQPKGEDAQTIFERLQVLCHTPYEEEFPAF
ncbi:MAG: hypothetical protein H6850_02065 [Alphaproteobacteria bacterium]|nr:MAG: hypothetical protein H6850_02065 [Alphaproteobacteria bacterium]